MDYLKVDIAGEKYTRSLPLFTNNPHVYMLETFEYDVPDNKKYVSIKIDVWDDDHPLNDEQCDISGTGLALDITYDMTTSLWSGEDNQGDSNGYGFSSGIEDDVTTGENNAEIHFEVMTTGADLDGLTAWSEVYRHNTKPDVTDTDGDGIDDGWEVRYDYRPDVRADPPTDDDPDMDGITTIREYSLTMKPIRSIPKNHQDIFVEVDWIRDNSHWGLG